MSAGTDRRLGPARWQQVIGILGGMGPHAHIELEKQLLAATADFLGRPPSDQDYPAWRLASFPETPDRTLALLGRGPSPVPWLERGILSITAGAPELRAGFVVMACVTAHAFLVELQQRVAVPILDMIAETVSAAADLGAHRIGVLATTGTLRAQVYQDAVARAVEDIEVVSLLDVEDHGVSGSDLQELLVMDPVYGPRTPAGRAGGGLKSGLAPGPRTREIVGRLEEGVRLLKAARADLVVLGCTELPIVIRGESQGIRLLDPMEVAARVAIELAAGVRAAPNA